MSKNGCFLLAVFSTSTFIVSWYFKVFFYYYILTTMSFLLSSTLFASIFTAESSLASSCCYTRNSITQVTFPSEHQSPEPVYRLEITLT